MNNIIKLWLLAMTLTLCLTSCAAGSIAAGVSGHALQANQLTAAGEQRIVDRVKSELSGCYDE